MPANTAWIHLTEDQVSDKYIPRGGRDEALTGLARVYRLSTAIDFDNDGLPDEYVVVRILFDREHMRPEIALFPCDETGHIYKGTHVIRRGGSMTLPVCPKDNEHAIEFAIAIAFQFYDVTVIDTPPEPEPEPEEPQLPEGLDYDPDDLPDESWYFERPEPDAAN